MIRKTFPAAFAFALAATLAAAPLAFAQAPQQSAPAAQAAPAPSDSSAAPARTPDPHHQAMRISHQLKLTSDQTARLEPILADRDQKIAALRADSSLAPRDARKQIHAIQRSTRSQLGAVLTADQLNQLEAMKHAHGHHSKAQPATPPSA